MPDPPEPGEGEGALPTDPVPVADPAAPDETGTPPPGEGLDHAAHAIDAEPDRDLGASAEPCGDPEPAARGGDGGDGGDEAEDAEPARPGVTLALSHPHFVPWSEDLQLTVTFTGPLDQIAEADLWVVSDKAPDDDVHVFEFADDFVAAGGGTTDWNGDLPHGPASYDGYLSLKMSPYEVSVVLTTKGGEKIESNVVPLEVKLDHVTIEVAYHDALGLDGDKKKTARSVAANFAAGQTCHAIHDGTVFKIDSDEMNDGSSASEYSAHVAARYGHSNGAVVPVFARVYLKLATPTDQPYGLAPKEVMKGCRVMFDVEVEAGERSARLQARGLHAQASSFFGSADAVTFEKDTSNPPGDTAHYKFGGVRRSAGDRAWHFVQAHATWPLYAVSNREWSRFARCAVSDDLEYWHAGAFFRTGRIAGDSFLVRAFLELDQNLNQRDNAALPGTGSPERSDDVKVWVWRKAEIAHSWKVGQSTRDGHDPGIGGRDLALQSMENEFLKAGLHVDTSAVVHDTGQHAAHAAWYRAYIQEKRRTAGMGFLAHAALETNPQGHPISYKSWTQYATDIGLYRGFRGFFKRVGDFFRSSDDEAYLKECKDHSYDVVRDFARSLTTGDDGLYLVKFAGWGIYWVRDMDIGVNTTGWAPFISGVSSRNKAFFFVFMNGTASDTLTHEVGHQLFLAHAPGSDNPGQTNPTGYQPQDHDAADVCIMSYRDRKNGLCALCLMKLAGWDVTKIDNQGKVL